MENMRYAILFLALLASGCATGDKLLLSEADPVAGLQVPKAACEQPADARCVFINSPVKLDNKPIKLSYNPYPFFRTREPLEFIDAKQQVWVAPAGILTDGASIPPIFVPLIGDPRSKEFMNAATVHDSYSAESNRDSPYYHAAPWQDVHRMFYDALRVSGTPAIKAKIMYAAVYLGGPRWKEVRKPPTSKRQAAIVPRVAPGQGGRLLAHVDDLTIEAVAAGVRDLQSDTPLPELFSKEQLMDAFKRAAAYIRAANPSIAEVEIFLTRLELGMTSARNLPGNKQRNFGPRIYLPGEQRPFDEGGGSDSGATGGDGYDGGGSSEE